MHVITDIEWIVDENRHYIPSQLAALRVDSGWNISDEFAAFIRPKDLNFNQWNHVGYTGGTPREFLHAENVYKVLNQFMEWLKEDDIILWWRDESDTVLRNLVKFILKKDIPNRSVFVSGYVHAFLSGKASPNINLYKTAEKQQVDIIKELEHNSENDVKVFRELMKKISYPQSSLLDPAPVIANVTQNENRSEEFCYQYDIKNNVIHTRECKKIASIPTKGYKSLKTSISKGYKPCDCCKDDYRKAVRERNADIIERSQLTYIYTPGSDIFHKYTCKQMLNAKVIMGAQKYKTIQKMNMRPCRVCNPTPDDLRKFVPPKKATVNKVGLKKNAFSGAPTMSADSLKAVRRQKIASAERLRKLSEENHSKTEIDDIYTLTQPRFAFWGGQGYHTFHLRSCPKLNTVNHLIGFATYEEAIRSGFSPCRKCNPSPKHDVKFSIPITSKVKENENIKDLENLCLQSGYEYGQIQNHFIITTPVGKWKINTQSMPVKLEHINLYMTPNETRYHLQPRLFLSLEDTFEYIKRHDNEIIKKDLYKKNKDNSD